MRLPGLLVGVYVVVAIIWGPNPTFLGVPYLIRILYLTAVPSAAWIALTLVWRTWRPDLNVEHVLFRAVTMAIAVAFFVGAGLATQESTHLECTELIKVGHQEAECIGEYVEVPGPDREVIFFMALGGVISFLVSWKSEKEEDEETGETQSL